MVSTYACYRLTKESVDIEMLLSTYVSVLLLSIVSATHLFSLTQTVKRNAEQYGLPLKILSYSELYGGWTMDKVVAEVGKKGNCKSLPHRIAIRQGARDS